MASVEYTPYQHTMSVASKRPPPGSFAWLMIEVALMPLCLLVLGAAACAAEPSLCGGGETPLFTCPVGKKVVSICGSGGKATYHFGRPGRVEMSSDALSFAETAFSDGGETQISFRNGAYIYTVYDKTTRTSFSSDGHHDPDFSSGLVVQKSGKTISALACGTDATISPDASRVIKAGSFIEH